ncbi:transporter [Hyphomicrobium sp. 99]|uniref:SphA family protein n=1 Tax=Hyphomicrobium sp. 99 TaxID=1163419 RepID=UPI0005F7B321|nr:transporter [Hyphomicrobium sp. 99]
MWCRLRKNITFATAVCAFGPFSISEVRAAEGGLTNYVPGYYGDFAVAVAPQNGLYVYGTAYSYQAKLKGPAIPDTVSASAMLYLSGFQYVTDHKIFGATYAFGAYTTFLDAHTEAKPPPFSLDASIADRGDTSISPLVLYWAFGNLYVSAYQSIIIPTGSYDDGAALNASRNYFTFDSVVALTWLDQKQGLEISLVPGVMFNTENPATDYRTGDEFHLDGMLNKYFSQSFAVGLHGYFYSQFTNDSGAGTPSIRSASAGVGPALLWNTTSIGIPGKIVGKWLHEVDATNRFQGDILSVTAALKF